MRDRIGPQREIAGVHRGIDEPRGRIEGGVNVAAAGAAAAGAATEALAPILVLHAIGRDAGAIGRQHTPHRRQTLAQRDLRRREFVGTLEQAVRQVRQVLIVTGNPEVRVDLVVVRLDVCIGNRPVLAVPVVRFSLEVVIRQPQRQTAPDVGLAAQQARADPGVARAGVRMILLVHQNVLDVVRSAPATDVGEHVLERGAFGVGRLPDGVLIEAQRMVARRKFAPARVIVRPLHRAQLLLDGNFLPRFEQQDLHPLRRQHMGRHAARRSRTHHHGVVGAGQIDVLFLRCLESNESHQRSP